MFLYLIRHGEPDYKTDSLTEKGKIQASLVAQRLQSSNLDRIFSSPMGRARETAEYTCKLLGKEMTVLPWAKEISEKTTFPDGIEKGIESIPNFSLRTPEFLDLDFYHSYEVAGFNTPSFREKSEVLINGSREFLKDLGYEEENGIYKITKPSDEKIALFCHGNMTRSLLGHILHIPNHLTWSGMGVNFTGITIVYFKNYPEGYTAPKVLTFSDCAHLSDENGEINYNNRMTI